MIWFDATQSDQPEMTWMSSLTGLPFGSMSVLPLYVKPAPAPLDYPFTVMPEVGLQKATAAEELHKVLGGPALNALPKSSVQWLTAMRKRPRIGASPSASGSTSAT